MTPFDFDSPINESNSTQSANTNIDVVLEDGRSISVGRVFSA